MSTVPVAVSPGFMVPAVSRAVPGVLPIVSVPVVKTLPGLAADAVKLAPDPTVMPTAARTTASAPRVRRGCATRACRRVTCFLQGGETDYRRPVARYEGEREAGCLPASSVCQGPFLNFAYVLRPLLARSQH